MNKTENINLTLPVHLAPGWSDDLNENFKILDQEIGALKKDTNIEIGTITLTNSMEYPFSNSERTIALEKVRNNQNYKIDLEIIDADGSCNLLPAYDKQLNGFKIAFIGNATTSTIRYFVQGGIV